MTMPLMDSDERELAEELAKLLYERDDVVFDDVPRAVRFHGLRIGSLLQAAPTVAMSELDEAGAVAGQFEVTITVRRVSR